MKKEAKIQEKLRHTQRIFRVSCTQIVMLNERLGSMSRRYNVANKQGRKSFRYSLRLRLAVIEALRNIYYDYAKIKAERAKELGEMITDMRAGNGESPPQNQRGGDATQEVVGSVDETEANFGEREANSEHHQY